MKRTKRYESERDFEGSNSREIEGAGGENLARAVVLNEALRRKAKKGWNSVEVIGYWKERRYGKPVR